MPRLFLETERMANINSGLGQVCLHLGHELVRQCPPGWEITFLVPQDQIGVFGPSVEYITATRWRRVWHPWKFDVWHSLYQGTRYLPMRKARFIYTILDLNYLALTEITESRKQRQKQRYQHAIDKANAITTISEYVARDVSEQLMVPTAVPLKAIYCGVNTPDTISSAPPSVQPDRPFLFFIGMIQPYKNIHTMLPLLEAFPDYQLVVAGPNDRPYGREMQQEAERIGVADRLLMPGPVNEATKWWLYANCDAFLFPSLMEGFGLPVVEAMRFGKPVFSSPLTSLPEVGGPDAFYFQSFEPKAVIDTFRQGMDTYRQDPSMADRLKQYSQQFRWNSVAAEYWTLYQDIASR